MGRRKRTSVKSRPAESKRPQAVPRETTPQRHASARRVILFVIVLVFLIFEASVILIFQSGGSIRWKKELVAIEAVFEAGDYGAAARRLEEFGGKWPGAKETFDWNRKMGLYSRRAGNWEKAAEYYLAAAAIDPGAPKIHALAGEALWKSGQRERAVEELRAEIETINRAVGDHDRANFYLGLAMKERGRYAEAFGHFQSITERGEWEGELERLYAEAESELIEPARKKAREASLAEIPE